MKRKLSIFVIMMLVFSLGFGSAYVYGASLGDIKTDIRDQQAKLKEGQKKESALSKDIRELEIEIGKLVNSIEALQSKIDSTEDKIAIAKVELEKSEREVEEQNDNLNSRLRTMYKHGSIGFLDVLLGSGSISEFISNVDMVKKIYTSDKDVLSALQDEYDAIEKQKNELTALEKSLKEDKATQATEKAELSANKSAVAKKKANVVASNEALEDNIADLNAEADRIQAIIDANEGKNNNNGGGSSGGDGGSSGGGGKFAWPVPSSHRITSAYGWRNCPFHGREFHSGIDIGASYGKSVVAVSGGSVIFAGYLGSYGNTVIVSHGNSLYTLYAHNSSIVKWSGSVSRGQTIARIGSTGSSTGNHSHFEVRKGGNSHGNHTNPWNYL